MIGYVARYMLTSHFAHIDVSEEDNSHREESVDAGHGVRVETVIKLISFRYALCQNSEIEKFRKSEHKEMLLV